MPMPGNMSLGVSSDLGLGLGGQLSQQVQDETDEQRKKRMLDAQQNSLLGPASSLAASALFGGVNGRAQ
jgi:hypothetical protein